MTRIFKKPRVREDLIEHFVLIARDKLELAERFLRVAEEALARIAGMPIIGRAWESELPHLAGVRVYPMPAPFRNYLIFYRTMDDGIEDLTVLHGARNLEAALRRMSFE